jgi:hypothetical protein
MNDLLIAALVLAVLALPAWQYVIACMTTPLRAITRMAKKALVVSFRLAIALSASSLVLAVAGLVLQ